MARSFAASFFVMLGMVAFPAIAHAAETSAGEHDPSTSAPVRDLSFRASLGGYDDFDSRTGGFNIGGSALYRHDLLLVGGLVEHGAALFDYSYTAVAPAIGIAVPVPSWARIEVTATTGAHLYDGVGKGFLSADPGASGIVPFGGARAYAGVALGGRAFRFSAGIASWVEADVFRPTVTYTFRETFLTDTEETVTRNVGMSRAGLSLVLGGQFGL